MISWLKNYGRTHLVYIILIAAGIFGFQTWLREHDARQAAEAKVRQNDVTVQSLQDAIIDRDKALATQEHQTVKIVHDVQTPAQAIAALPALVSDPVTLSSLDVKPADDDKKAVEVQAITFTELLGQFKDTRDELQTCQMDLSDEKKIVATDEDSIKALKKKPGFWKRIAGTGKAVGVGIGIGVVIAKKFL